MSTLNSLIITRADLVGALLGQRPKGRRKLSVDTVAQLGSEDVALLYEDEITQTLSALVVRDDALADMFAWLDTYAPQFSPITQYCRVVTPEGSRLYTVGRVERGDSRLIRALAGVVVGEVIAQTSSAAIRSLDGVTLSHAQATYSLCFARSELLRRAGIDLQGSVIGGLEVLDRMRVFPERILPAMELFPFWTMAFGLPQNSSRSSEVASVLTDAVQEVTAASLSPSTVMRLAQIYEPARELMTLQTYSAEERVKSFDRLNAEAGGSHNEGARAIEDFCLAYAAVEIGGGSTRHVGLLQEYGERRPLVWLWFGLLASIGEGDKWHPAFGRIGKLIQRELEYSFDPWDPPRADISLDEFLSVQRGSSRSGWLSELPRAHARALVVEVAAGVPFQFSIAVGERKEAAAERSPVDVTRLDEAMAALWAFRQSLVPNVGNSNSGSTKSSKSSKRAKSNKPKKDSLF